MNPVGGYSTFEHPLDVLNAFASSVSSGKRATLAIVTHTQGGAVRAPGALMAIDEDGETAGYVSGGCIDSDIALHAHRAIETGQSQTLIYGAGSPFVDLPLPCGGSIEVRILTPPSLGQISRVKKALESRHPVTVVLHADGSLSIDAESASPDAFCVCYAPKLKIRIAGRGADSLALAQICRQAGFQVHFQSPDPVTLSNADDIGCDHIEPLTTPRDIPVADDDPWTAFVLMFHDLHWETALLEQAVAGPAFYIGAVGSKNAHARRLEALSGAGMPTESSARIKGPIGMVPSMRDASGLAISTLAEIISFAPRAETTA